MIERQPSDSLSRTSPSILPFFKPAPARKLLELKPIDGSLHSSHIPPPPWRGRRDEKRSYINGAIATHERHVETAGELRSRTIANKCDFDAFGVTDPMSSQPIGQLEG